ncbi:MAG TPA: hypothetical protein VEQ67_20170, partial [Mycobacterium sp.]|nr:hypothetical protein [Mycobacterium sp.]
MVTTVEIITVSGALDTAWLSVTVSRATYRPAWSAAKDGVAVSAPLRVAALFAGRRMKFHWNVIGSPSASLDPRP